MYRISTLNKISSIGLNKFSRDEYEIASGISDPDAIMVRSQNIHDYEFPSSLKAIARAGAGVNNIPVDKCTEKGIVVFNTPGANANGVKELVLSGIYLSSRKIFQGMNWVKSLDGKGDEIPQLVEKGKKNFGGPEIRGKKLGVIGLGAIGVMVANDAVSLGMEVTGYDPFLSVDSAWGMSRAVKKAPSLDMLIADSDYITIHVPLNDNTRGLLNKEKFTLMKKDVRILNFSRGGLVSNKCLKEALDSGKVACYVTDFPDQELLNMENVLCIPHLGASTPEAEDNCAVMASEQLRDYLETGNIRNSVNFPNCEMPINGHPRIALANRNVPNMVGQITTLLAQEGININDLTNRHRNDFAYNIIDVSGDIPEDFIERLRSIDGVLMARLIK